MVISNANSCVNDNTNQSLNQEQKLGYVYRHIRLDRNEVFYIGKGTNTNGGYSRSNRTDGRNKHWHNIVNKHDYKVEIVIENLTEQEANKKEIALILHYGRLDLGTGTLVNMTAGGDGCHGRKHTEEAKKKISAKHKGREHTAQSRKNMSDAHKGKKPSKETIEKRRNSSHSKRVGQYKDGNLLKEYPSISSTKLDGFIKSHVGGCCNGRRKSHGGYQWKFL